MLGDSWRGTDVSSRDQETGFLEPWCSLGAARVTCLFSLSLSRAAGPAGAPWLQVIKGRRESGVKEEDMLQVLIDSRYRNVYGGRATTDEEIAGLLIAILFAGQHTSSVTASWTGYRMLSTRKWFEVGARAGLPGCVRQGGANRMFLRRCRSRAHIHTALSTACALGPDLCPRAALPATSAGRPGGAARHGAAARRHPGHGRAQLHGRAAPQHPGGAAHGAAAGGPPASCSPAMQLSSGRRAGQCLVDRLVPLPAGTSVVKHAGMLSHAQAGHTH